LGRACTTPTLVDDKINRPGSTREEEKALKVTFTNVDEFIKELVTDSDKIDRKIVRGTFTYNRRITLPSNNGEEVIAGYSVEGQLVELRVFTGYVTEFNADNEPRIKLGGEIMDKLQKACRALDLSFRAGLFQE
jgi:hypothetical protein